MIPYITPRLRDRLPSYGDVAFVFFYTVPGLTAMALIGFMLMVVTWPLTPVVLGVSMALHFHELWTKAGWRPWRTKS